MTLPRIVSRDEWLVARRDLLAGEKEATRMLDALHARRRELPMVRIDKEYVFDGPDGKATLLDLFDGRPQLIIYHAMFGPDWDAACPSCSYLIDSIGHQEHLHAANTSLALVSRAPIDKLEAYRARMGWAYRWVSSYGSDFNYDFHVTIDESVAPVVVNYRDRTELECAGLDWATSPGEHHGLSVFLRDGERVFHTYSAYARGTEHLVSTFGYLDRTPLGRQEDAGIMHWVRRHDEYAV